MLLISKDDIKKVVNMKDIIEAVKAAFSMKENGTIESPIRTAINGENGVFLFMPSYSSSLGSAAIKIVSCFPENARNGLLTNPAQVLLIDGKTGYITSVIDGAFLTQIRTGAASGAAFDILAKKNCRKGALIGTGGQAAAQLEAMLTVRKLDEVCVYSPDKSKCENFVSRMQKEFPHLVTDIKAAKSAGECVADADLIITATTSETPVFDGNLIKPGATLSCVGTFEPDKHELDPAALVRASKIFCDSKEAVLSESGDLLIPLSDGTISESDITGSIGEVINGKLPGRESDEEIIVFETVGIAAQDLAAAEMIYEKALKAGIGLNYN